LQFAAFLLANSGSCVPEQTRQWKRRRGPLESDPPRVDESECPRPKIVGSGAINRLILSERIWHKEEIVFIIADADWGSGRIKTAL